MLKKMTFVLALSALMAASSIAPAFASHRTTVCGDNPGANETLSGTSVRQVLVPENSSCTLDNVTVEKDVVVLEGGRVFVSGSTIGDDLRAEDAASIRVDCRVVSGACSDTSSVGDDIVVSGTTSVPSGFSANYICNGTSVGDGVEISESNTPWQIGGGFCENSTQPVRGVAIGGELEVEGNQAPVGIDRNRIARDLDVEDNGALVTITNNFVGDDLECHDNNPPPTASPSNNVGDDTRGQCETGFRGTPASGTPPAA